MESLSSHDDGDCSLIGDYVPDQALFDSILTRLDGLPSFNYPLTCIGSDLVDPSTGVVVWKPQADDWWRPPPAVRGGELGQSSYIVHRDPRLRPEIEAALMYAAHIKAAGLTVPSEVKGTVTELLADLTPEWFTPGRGSSRFDLSVEVRVPLAKTSKKFSRSAYIAGLVRKRLSAALLSAIAFRAEKTPEPKYITRLESDPWVLYLGSDPGTASLTDLVCSWRYSGDVEVLTVRAVAWVDVREVSVGVLADHAKFL